MNLTEDIKRKGIISEIIRRLGVVETNIRKLLSGFGGLSQVAAIYTTSVAQSIPNNTSTIIDFGTLVKDTNSAVTTGAAWKFTAPYSGYYQVDVLLLFAAQILWVDGEKGQIYLYVDGVETATLDRKDNFPNSNLFMQLGGGTVVYLAAGSYIDIRVVQTCGSAIPLQGDAKYNRIAIAAYGATGATGATGPQGPAGSGSGGCRECLTANRTYYVGFDQGTCTMTIASPCVVTDTAHGLSNDDPVVFRTTGTLPTGITAGTAYYVINKTADTFQLSASVGGAAINTSGSQSGTHSYHTGNDANNGLTTGRAGALLTPQQGIDLTAALDISIYDVAIRVANGAYTGANTLKTIIGAGLVTILGDDTTPSNVIISTTSADCFLADGILGRWRISGLKLQTTTSGHGLSALGGTVTVTLGKIDFGTIANSDIVCQLGATVTLDQNYTISGGAERHWNILAGLCQVGNVTITLTGTPAFSGEFCRCERVGYIRCNGATFSGSATGKRYDALNNGVIFTNGGGANFLPGNVAGTTDGFGVYN